MFGSGLVHWVFLEEMLPELLDETPLTFRRYVWFQHDGAVAHLACQVWKHLTAT